MTFAVFVVMITGGIRVLNKCLCKESLHRFICTARIAAIECDASLLHSHLRTSADTCADKYICLSQLFSCAVIDRRDGRSCNVHITGALLLCFSLIVDRAYGLKLIKGQLRISDRKPYRIADHST